MFESSVWGSRTIQTFFGRGHYEEHFCEIIQNLDHMSRRYFLPRALEALWEAEWNPLGKFGRGHHGEHFC